MSFHVNPDDICDCPLCSILRVQEHMLMRHPDLRDSSFALPVMHVPVDNPITQYIRAQEEPDLIGLRFRARVSGLAPADKSDPLNWKTDDWLKMVNEPKR